MKKRIVLSCLFCATAFWIGVSFIAVSTAGGDTPQILKVEPPNWWVKSSLNPVRLLIHGKNLANAVVVSPHKKIKLLSYRINESGTYLFVDIKISSSTPPGFYPIEITTPAGRAVAAFEILAPLSKSNRFQGFSGDDIIYLIMPDRFADGDSTNNDPETSHGLWNRSKNRYYHGGDLQGIIDHLPYLKDLGITAIWLNPIYDNANRLNEKETYNNEAITDYHGYGAVDFYAVEEHFGDIALFRKLVDRAHELGINVIQDQVANHTGPYHPWVKDSPTPTWYHGTEANHLSNTWQTWTLMDPYATRESQQATLEGWFINILPDLNQEDADVKQYLIQNTLWWIGISGIDGIRQDTLPYVPRRFWRDWTMTIKREYPHFSVVGEMWDGNAAKVAFFQGGITRYDGVDSGIDALFDFPLFYSIRQVFAEKKSFQDLASTLALDYLYPHPENLVTFLSLHDVPRFMNEPNADITGLKLAFTFLMTARGIPLIYYGDEIALPGGGDPDNRRDFPGGWKEDNRNAFDPQGRTPQEQDVFAHVRKLTHLRQELEPLRSGETVNLFIDPQIYIYARVKNRKVVLVAFNNDTNLKTVDCPSSALPLSNGMMLQDRLGLNTDIRVSGGRISLSLSPRSGSVFTTR